MIGAVLVLSLVQFSLAGFELGSKSHVSVLSCHLSDCLRSYLIVGFLWALGVTFLAYANYHWIGAFTAIIINLILIAWIYYSFKNSFLRNQRYLKERQTS